MATTTTTTKVDEARDQLDLLLALPDERPGCWEAEHVRALGPELRTIRSLLGG